MDGTILEHCIIEYSNAGIKFRDSAEAHIEECRFSENNWGISFNHMANSNIRKSKFFNNQYGLYAEYYLVNYNKVIRGIYYGTNGSYMSGCRIEDNEIYSNTQDAIYASGHGTGASDNLFQNNTIRDNGGWGLYGRYGDVGEGFRNNTIKNNVMYNNTSGGIHFGDIGNVITGNKIFKNGTGISTQNCCTYGTNTITHNAISENEKGIQYDGKGGMRLEIENNHLINNSSVTTT